MFGRLFETGLETLRTGERKQYDEVMPYIQDDGQVNYRKGRKNQNNFSCKHKHIAGNKVQPCKKEKILSDLLFGSGLCFPNGEHTSKGETGDKLISHSSGKKRKANDVIPEDSSLKYNEGHLSTGTTKSLQMKQTLSVGDRISRSMSQLNRSSSSYKNGFSQTALSKDTHKKKSSCQSQSKMLIHLEQSSPHEILSQLYLTAKDPMKEYNSLRAMVHFLVDFRNSISMEDSSLKRIIQSISEEQPLMENQNGTGEFLPETSIQKGCHSFSQHVAAKLGTDLDSVVQHDDGNLKSEVVQLVGHSEENSKEDIYPTALILKFKSLDSVPLETNLHEIFSPNGPLIESQTEVLEKSSCAKVVFHRSPGTETVFSTACKYSIFGPSLVSYHLQYMPSTAKKTLAPAAKRGRKSKKSQECN
ncbi:Serine/threonine-protein kinase ATM [Quillaja saponaria]|uniref:Serine/threonine-protein kinase ATM n=1 Tax=Quillaja saponaria TaxID=32244 RepID=A0AAD7VEC7_QUISA|nr:Serine/threonine-protein kinase ATM [Quillaja saponaria]